MTQHQTTRICLEGWYYLFIVLFIIGGAVLGEVNLLVMLAGMMVGPFLFNWRFTQLTLRNLKIARRLAHRVCAGEELTIAVTAENHRTRLASWTIMIEDHVQRVGDPDRNHASAVRLVLPRVAVGQACTGQYRTMLMRRGRYTFGPMRASTRFPLGLVRSSMTLDQEDSLLVYPRLGHLTPRWLQVANSRLVGSQSEGRHQGMMEGDYFGLREWRSGDSQRWIHWRTSAKRGELSVRQFEQQRNRDLTLVLDLWQPDSPTEEEQATTELAVSFMATAVSDMCSRGGCRLALSVAGFEPQFWAGPAATILYQEVLDHLAEVEPGDGLDIYDVLNRVRQMGTAGSQTLVVSTRGAPFLTSGDDWESKARPIGPPQPYGNLTWIDCRSDALRAYFVPPR
jgi:uncharacterized protein (DUF58 family)